MAKLIKESHIHAGISTDFLKELPTSSEFKISVVKSDTQGLDHCIKTDSQSEVYWVKRGDRPNLSRMVVGEPISTNKVVVVEVPHEGQIVVATAYYGREVADKEPFTEDMTQADCEAWIEANPSSFWATHALVEEK